MNRECYVEIFRLKDKIYLRCFRDGTFVEITEDTTTHCPVCKRQLNIHGDYLYPKTRNMLQIYHPDFHNWMNIAPNAK